MFTIPLVNIEDLCKIRPSPCTWSSYITSIIIVIANAILIVILVTCYFYCYYRKSDHFFLTIFSVSQYHDIICYDKIWMTLLFNHFSLSWYHVTNWYKLLVIGCVEVVGCLKCEELVSWEAVPESVGTMFNYSMSMFNLFFIYILTIFIFSSSLCNQSCVSYR